MPTTLPAPVKLLARHPLGEAVTDARSEHLVSIVVVVIIGEVLSAIDSLSVLRRALAGSEHEEKEHHSEDYPLEESLWAQW